MTSKNKFEKANYYGKNRIPFVIISDFAKEKIEIFRLDELESENIHFSFCEDFSENISKEFLKSLKFKTETVNFKNYSQKFDSVQNAITKGNTYLFNLTQPTKLEFEKNPHLIDIYKNAKASFKLFYKNKFVSISPEIFIKIDKNSKISTFPMKGTLKISKSDSEIEARKNLFSDFKENSEHIMIVDLMRNDLNRVSKKVRVEKFKNIIKIPSGEDFLLQMNSIISGELDKNWNENIGSILDEVLPAGSITGTPKLKTVELINQIENYQRGFFTGVFGYFDGYSFKSAVMIRFIEKQEESLIYKSGGGITIDSDSKKEFQEMQEKIYLY